MTNDSNDSDTLEQRIAQEQADFQDLCTYTNKVLAAQGLSAISPATIRSYQAAGQVERGTRMGKKALFGMDTAKQILDLRHQRAAGGTHAYGYTPTQPAPPMHACSAAPSATITAASACLASMGITPPPSPEGPTPYPTIPATARIPDGPVPYPDIPADTQAPHSPTPVISDTTPISVAYQCTMLTLPYNAKMMIEAHQLPPPYNTHPIQTNDDIKALLHAMIDAL